MPNTRTLQHAGTAPFIRMWVYRFRRCRVYVQFYFVMTATLPGCHCRLISGDDDPDTRRAYLFFDGWAIRMIKWSDGVRDADPSSGTAGGRLL